MTLYSWIGGKKTNTIKRAGELDIYFSNNIQVINSYMKRYSRLQIIGEIEIKPTVSYNQTPLRMAIKETRDN